MKAARLRIIALLGFLCCASTGCESIRDWMGMQTMTGPNGTDATLPAQDTPELERRAAAEREELPKPPQPPDPASWSTLGSVPPKPVMPSPLEIVNSANALQTEQQAGAAMIDQQAAAPQPQTLPKPQPATPPAMPVSVLPIVSPPVGPFLSGAAPLEGGGSQVFSQDNQFKLPQSQTIEAPDIAQGVQ